MINCLNKGWLEGIPFYEFYRLGGLHSTIKSFNNLSIMLDKLDNDMQKQFIYLFDEVCQLMKDLLTSVMTLKNIDN